MQSKSPLCVASTKFRQRSLGLVIPGWQQKAEFMEAAILALPPCSGPTTTVGAANASLFSAPIPITAINSGRKFHLTTCAESPAQVLRSNSNACKTKSLPLALFHPRTLSALQSRNDSRRSPTPFALNFLRMPFAAGHLSLITRHRSPSFLSPA